MENEPIISSNISIQELKKMQIKIGTVRVAERVEKTDKLIRLTIDFGNEMRQIITGMAQFFAPEYFIGKQIPVIVNLEPKMLQGLESQGMIFAVDTKDGPVLLHPEKEVALGSAVI